MHLESMFLNVNLTPKGDFLSGEVMATSEDVVEKCGTATTLRSSRRSTPSSLR
jgi:hypothetical protein